LDSNVKEVISKALPNEAEVVINMYNKFMRLQDSVISTKQSTQAYSKLLMTINEAMFNKEMYTKLLD